MLFFAHSENDVRLLNFTIIIWFGLVFVVAMCERAMSIKAQESVKTFPKRQRTQGSGKYSR